MISIVKKKMLMLGRWLYGHFYLAMLIISAIALLISHVSELVFGIMPCKLCIYQRMPYYTLIFLTLFAMLAHHRLHKLYNYYISLSTLLVTFVLLLSVFHILVESGLIKYSSQCISDFSAISSIQDVKDIIEKADIIACNAKLWEFFGISMVGWSILYATFSLFLCCITLYAKFCNLTTSVKYDK